MKSLIVDDSKGWRDFHKRTVYQLFGEDTEIVAAESGSDGYDKLLVHEKNPFDLIISDLQMESDFAPLSAGEWFVKQVQNFPAYKNSKIIIISAMYNIEMTAELLGVDYISKRTLISGILPFKLKMEEMGFLSELSE